MHYVIGAQTDIQPFLGQVGDFEPSISEDQHASYLREAQEAMFAAIEEDSEQPLKDFAIKFGL